MWTITILILLAGFFLICSLIKANDVNILKDENLKYKMYHQKFIAAYVIEARERRRLVKKYNDLHIACIESYLKYYSSDARNNWKDKWALDFILEDENSSAIEAVRELLKEDRKNRKRIDNWQIK